jgi:hypothetical protein
MQVFLPWPSFTQSVRCLDKTRLGNQIWREAKTLLNGGWPNHPVAKMWADYKPALARYCVDGLYELRYRQDISTEAFDKHLLYFGQFNPFDAPMPPFIGDYNFHLSHRLNLLWKNPTWYTQFFDEPVPTSKPDYIWPSPQKIGAETEPKQ